MSLATRFNRSALSRFLNSTPGRFFRLAAGVTFIAVGALLWPSPEGIAAIAWGVFPLTAGAFDVCYISLALGGPFRGAGCRADAKTLGA
jgi:hypothetical protein